MGRHASRVSISASRRNSFRDSQRLAWTTCTKEICDRADVFATNADGTLTVIHQATPDSYHLVGSVATPTGSRNMGLDQTTHRIYVAAATFAPASSGSGQAGRGSRPTVVPGTFKLLVIER